MHSQRFVKKSAFVFFLLNTLFWRHIQVRTCFCIYFSLTVCFSNYTAQKVKFSINDFFSKCNQIRSILRIWTHLLNKFLMKNFIFCAMLVFSGYALCFNNYSGEVLISGWIRKFSKLY